MKRIWIAALVVVSGCSGCSARSGNGDVDLGDSFGDWKAELGSRSSSRITGEAGLQSAVAASGARISIKGAAAGAEHPWHVHTGSCGSGGGIVGSASAYPVLKVGDGGEASAVATLGIALDENSKYHVNVHRSPTEMNVIVACGELKN